MAQKLKRKFKKEIPGIYGKERQILGEAVRVSF